MRAWINGRTLQSPDEPALSLLDHGFVVGDGVFETIKVVDGTPFALTRHLQRLVRSAVGLGIGEPDLGFIRRGIEATVAGQQLPLGRIRITVTSGRGPLGSMRGELGQTVAIVTERTDVPEGTTSIVTVPWVRNERGALSGLKTTSYAENALMLQYALENGGTEAVMANSAGLLCEGTGSSVFYALDGQLVTPTLESGCLAGVTRALLLEWCREEMDVVERDAPIEVLQQADEVFIASTTRDVQAVHRVDGRSLRTPGPMTALAAEIFEQLSKEQVDP